MKNVLFAFALAMLVAGSAFALDDFEGDAYPLNTCPVSGEALGSMGEPIQVVLDGRDVRLCCAGCTKRATADPAKYLAKIDDAIVAQQKPLYPVDTCLVSGQELGSMGEPIGVVHGNRLVQLCCAGCTRKVASDPASFIAKLDEAAIAAQQDAYALDACVVTGEKLSGSPKEVSLVVGGRLVRLCCAGCENTFNEHPAKYLGMIESGKLEIADSEGSDHKH